jgi:hypothetical protein
LGLHLTAENSILCLDANDDDTDNDGILEGNEDADYDGAVDAREKEGYALDTLVAT